MAEQIKPKIMGNLHYFYDPSHGWLRVPINHIRRLNIADKISHCSMIRGRYAFLEEDCDAHTFFVALKDSGYNAGKVTYTSTDKSSKLRGYDDFSQERYKVALSDPLNGPMFGTGDDVSMDDTVIHQVFMEMRTGFIWLISEIAKSDRNLAFGWARLAVPEFAEWGTMDIAEMKQVGARPIKGWPPMLFKHAEPQVERWIQERHSGVMNINPRS